jgi:hypothetical protein
MRESVITVGQITSVSRGVLGPAHASYRYQVEGEIYGGTTQLSLRTDANPVGENGMPVRPGDEFKLRYMPKEPTQSEILLNEPTENQIERYHQMAKDKCVKHRNSAALNLREVIQFCNCFMKAIYKQEGISGYADVYFQDLSYLRYSSHNKRTHKKLMQQKSIQKGKRQCAQQYVNNPDEL